MIPINNLRIIVKNKVAERQPSIDTTFAEAIMSGAKMSEDCSQSLIYTIPDIIAAEINNKGCNTEY